MNILLWIFGSIVYATIGAILTGLSGDDDLLLWLVTFWPFFLIGWFIYATFGRIADRVYEWKIDYEKKRGKRKD